MCTKNTFVSWKLATMDMPRAAREPIRSPTLLSLTMLDDEEWLRYNSAICRNRTYMVTRIAKAPIFRAWPKMQLSGEYVPVSLMYGNSGSVWCSRTDIVYVMMKVPGKRTNTKRGNKYKYDDPIMNLVAGTGLHYIYEANSEVFLNELIHSKACYSEGKFSFPAAERRGPAMLLSPSQTFPSASSRDR